MELSALRYLGGHITFFDFHFLKSSMNLKMFPRVLILYTPRDLQFIHTEGRIAPEEFPVETQLEEPKIQT